MKRIGKNVDVTNNPVSGLKMLAKDRDTRNILFGILWHTRKEKESFKMKELQRFAVTEHNNDCTKKPEMHEKQWSKELRWEKAELRLSNLCEMGLVEKLARKGTKVFNYKLSRGAQSLENWCEYWSVYEDDMLQALYSGGFKRALRRMECIEPLGYRPVHKSVFDRGSFGIVTPLERTKGWLFSPTYIATPSDLLDPSYQGPDPSPSSRIIENLGFMFEDLFGPALDEACPEGWMILVCSKNLAKDVFEKGWYIPAQDEGRKRELKEIVQKAMSSDSHLKSLLDPLFILSTSS